MPACLCSFYESPVTTVIEGTGFHPLVVPARRDGGYWKEKYLPEIKV